MIDLDELERLAKAATPQDIDSAEIIHDTERGLTYCECPVCGGDGSVVLDADYCNYDHTAIGVQFYGIGPEHGAAEAYFRAVSPAKMLALIAEVRELRKDKARLDSGVIMTHERDEFGDEYTCERHGNDLRAMIDAALAQKEG